MSRAMTWWGGSVQLFCLDPFHTLVACEFEGKALGSHNHSNDVDKNVAADCFPREVEIFISLYEESCHRRYLASIIILNKISSAIMLVASKHIFELTLNLNYRIFLPVLHDR